MTTPSGRTCLGPRPPRRGLRRFQFDPRLTPAGRCRGDVPGAGRTRARLASLPVHRPRAPDRTVAAELGRRTGRAACSGTATPTGLRPLAVGSGSWRSGPARSRDRADHRVGRGARRSDPGGDLGRDLVGPCIRELSLDLGSECHHGTDHQRDQDETRRPPVERPAGAPPDEQQQADDGPATIAPVDARNEGAIRRRRSTARGRSPSRIANPAISRP